MFLLSTTLTLLLLNQGDYRVDLKGGEEMEWLVIK